MTSVSEAQRERFCEEFIIDLHGTQAAIRAGYSAKTARQQATRLLSKADIQARVAELQAERAQRTAIDADRVLRELGLIGFANMQDYTEVVGTEGKGLTLAPGRATRDQLAAVAEITVEDFTDGRGEDAREVRRTKLRLHSKLGALNTIAEHLGMLNKKVELTGKVSLEQLVAESFKPEG